MQGSPNMFSFEKNKTPYFPTVDFMCTCKRNYIRQIYD